MPIPAPRSRVWPDRTILAISGNLTLESGSTLGLTLGKSAAHAGQQPDTTDYSQINLTGAGTLSGSTLALTIGSGIQTGDIFVLILDGTAVGGTFAGIPTNLSTFSQGGQSFEINYLYNPSSAFASTNTGGTDVALLAVAVPEPGSLATLTGGLGLLAGLQRFRRRVK